ncbi:hypothetical protein EYZ11_003076 [Aspergillus tanneri]|uniref:Uncharacterized protein n=1 Tax=Aspergillus tanneri TaxID=1220188 RepID=A0A4S3JRB2_9EURO|nr:uncharacterized protein ATNIH1004_010793 [Aspergillus tanneri]KAA8641854.1 hypothetical protein ATNIH1004_010793 [Aspergillus tanneri]THC97427.1 hypothetical protein EYZ11_003076 [Aspergillus tanneri]
MSAPVNTEEAETPTPEIKPDRLIQISIQGTPIDPTTKGADTFTTTTTTTNQYSTHKLQLSFLRLQFTLTSILVLITKYVCSPRLRSTIWQAARAHPLIASFLLCQIVCSAVPMGLFALFASGMFMAVGVGVAMFICLAAMLLTPIMIFIAFIAGGFWAYWMVIFLSAKRVINTVRDWRGDVFMNGEIEM